MLVVWLFFTKVGKQIKLIQINFNQVNIFVTIINHEEPLKFILDGLVKFRSSQYNVFFKTICRKIREKNKYFLHFHNYFEQIRF